MSLPDAIITITNKSTILAVTSSFPHGKGSEMARPKKENELAYTHHVNLRLTDTQFDIICKASEQADLSISEYIRRQVMKGKVIANYEIVADVPELKKLIAEFGKIGSNLNQIARHFNSGGIHSLEMRQAIDQSIARIYEMKYEVLKMAGEFHGNTKTHSE